MAQNLKETHWPYTKTVLLVLSNQTGHNGLEHQAVTHAMTDWSPPNLSIPTLVR